VLVGFLQQAKERDATDLDPCGRDIEGVLNSLFLVLRDKDTQAFSVCLVTLFFDRNPENFSFLLDLYAKCAPDRRFELASGETAETHMPRRIAASQVNA
jgi:hypothetical protein